jgi:hypothetical protein
MIFNTNFPLSYRHFLINKDFSAKKIEINKTFTYFLFCLGLKVISYKDFHKNEVLHLE